jgi:hypothetical protein
MALSLQFFKNSLNIHNLWPAAWSLCTARESPICSWEFAFRHYLHMRREIARHGREGRGKEEKGEKHGSFILN